MTVIEILSPTNKSGLGRTDYLEKREATAQSSPSIWSRSTCLFGGFRIALGRPLPPGDYYALVSRTEKRRPNCDVYAWSVRRALPTIPVPLSRPDADISLDLSKAFRADLQSCAVTLELVNYKAPGDTLPLAPSDRAWAEQQARIPDKEPLAGTLPDG